MAVNASFIDTHLKRGNHGYLELVVSASTYNTLKRAIFVAPHNSGVTLIIPDNANPVQIAQIKADHATYLNTYNEYKNVYQALKSQLIGCIDKIYIKNIGK